jgi:hypothetical protein
MKIEGAVAELFQNAPGHDHRGHEGDQAGAPQQLRTQHGKFARMLDRQHGESRIVSEQSGRQGRPFERAGQEDDGVEHGFFLVFSPERPWYESPWSRW